MHPFDLPPSTPPVSTDPPEPPPPGRRRGRMAIIGVAVVGLIAGGVAGVSQLASADRSEPLVGVPDDDATAPIDPVDESDEAAPDEEPGDESVDGSVDEPADEPATGDDERSADPPSIDGEIVIDIGDGEPIVVDLGELTADGEAFDEFAACAGFDVGGFPAPPFDPEVLPSGPLDDLADDFLDDLPDDFLDDLLNDLLDDMVEGGGRFELPPLGGVANGDGTHVTILGPDGVSVVELGDGDGSVTISRQDGEVTITTEGTATVQELGELFGELPIGDLGPGVPLDEFLDGVPSLDEAIGELAFPDPEKIEECLALLREQ